MAIQIPAQPRAVVVELSPVQLRNREIGTHKKWNNFCPARAARYYEQAGVMKRTQFSRLFEDAVRIRGLGVADLDWLLFDHALSAYSTVGLVHHYRAIAAGLDIEFHGIESFYQMLVQHSLLPPGTLNQTRCYQPAKAGLRIGEMLVQTGLVLQRTVDKSLEIQALISSRLGIRVGVGQILRSVGNLSAIDFFCVLGLQQGVQFTSLDDSAAKIFAATAATERQGTRGRNRVVQELDPKQADQS